MDTPSGLPNIAVAAHANIPYEQKWAVLKPVIERLYIDEDRTLAQVAEFMKEEHGFDAK